MMFPTAGREMAVRAFGLYGPVALAFGLLLGRRRERRMPVAVLLGVLWTMPALLALQMLNLRLGWWSFATGGPVLRGMPVELYLGWTVLWGAVPVLGFRRVRVGWAVAGMVIADLATMPLASPVVVLGQWWLVGEAVGAVLVLVPSVLLARCTLEDRGLGFRGAMQVVTAAGLFLYLPAEVSFALRGGGWGHARVGSLAVQALALLALPGVSAVQEFVERGQGTPIPYDPPRRLVRSGMYRYVANPMQLSCVLTMVAMGWLLGSGWMASGGALAWIYGVGIARWDEGQELKERFGETWAGYRMKVHDWRVRWRPYADPDQAARLYVSQECGVCAELGGWIRRRAPVGLVIVAAEEYTGGALRRMRYDPCDGGAPEDGARALARALEHVHIGWALVGAGMRLPGVRWVVQAIGDGVGFGEREAAGTERHSA